MISLAYVLTIGFAGYFLANALVSKDERLEVRYLAVFVIVNAVGFLTFSNYLFIAVVAIALLSIASRDPVMRTCMFLFLFPLLPSLAHSLDIGSFSLMYIDWPRLLAMVLLLPLLFRPDPVRPFFSFPTDKYVLAYFILHALLSFRDTTVTAGMRSVFYLLIEVVLPYYAISRYLTTGAEIRRGILALLCALVIAGLINVFETLRSWHVYDQMIRNVVGHITFMPGTRAGMLRAFGSLDKPSAAAFAMAAGLGLVWALAPYPGRRKVVLGVIGALSAGLLFTFSRGSWVAAALIGMAFLFTTNAKQFFRVVLGLGLVLIPLSFTETAEEVMAILPFVGEETTEAARTVEYREDLFAASVAVAHENPLLGSTTYDEHPRMEAIRQVSGLLDLVNHYMLLLLRTGYLGLLTFVAIFLSTLLRLRKAISAARDRSSEEEQIRCRALLYTLLALLVAISTTSALGRVGLILWCLVGFAATSCELLDPRVRRGRTPARSAALGRTSAESRQ